MTSFPQYNYPGFQYNKVVEWRRVVKQIRDAVDQVTGQSSTFVNVKKYPVDAAMDWHQDKTKEWAEGAGVAIISFGYTRQLQIGVKTTRVVIDKKDGTKRTRESKQVVRTIDMHPGMIFFLGPETNKQYYHRVKPLTPLQQAKAGERWSLQFREVVVYGKPRLVSLNAS